MVRWYNREYAQIDIVILPKCHSGHGAIKIGSCNFTWYAWGGYALNSVCHCHRLQSVPWGICMLDISIYVYFQYTYPRPSGFTTMGIVLVHYFRGDYCSNRKTYGWVKVLHLLKRLFIDIFPKRVICMVISDLYICQFRRLHRSFVQTAFYYSILVQFLSMAEQDLNQWEHALHI